MEITLSRNAWHYKLQRFTFDRDPHFVNFCPYFWLTIFCLIVSPFTGIIAGGKWFFESGLPLIFPFVETVSTTPGEPA